MAKRESKRKEREIVFPSIFFFKQKNRGSESGKGRVGHWEFK